MAKHSYQLRTPIHSSETTAIASKSVRARQDNDSADSSDKALDYSRNRYGTLKYSDILNKSSVGKNTESKHDKFKECLELTLRLIKLDKCIHYQSCN